MEEFLNIISVFYMVILIPLILGLDIFVIGEIINIIKGWKREE